jgi:hypothetical protein
MATQKVRPDADRDGRQRVQRQRVRRTLTFGALAIAAIIGAIAVLIAIVAVGPQGSTTSTPVVSAVGGGGPGSDTNSTPPPVPERPAHLPGAGVSPSRPLHGDLIKEEGRRHPWSATYLYADGRLISAGATRLSYDASDWVERRLTPEGVRLLRTRASLDTHGLPASAWKDRKPRPYVAARYRVAAPYGDRKGPGFVAILPPAARELLLTAGEPVLVHAFVLRTDYARMLVKILSDRGFHQLLDIGTCTPPGEVVYSGSVQAREVKHLSIMFFPVLPNGQVINKVCG